MATRTNNNKTYYINPAYLTFVEDSGYGANLIQVSASSSCWISVYDPSNGISYSDADKNYQRWKVTAYNNKFPDNQAYRIYARLEIGGTSALIIYSTNTYPVSDGSYYYILIGNVSATDGSSIREVTYDTGYLESVQGSVDANDLNDMWELDKYSSPWLIKAKQWLHSFTVKGFVTLIGGWVFKKGETEKAVTDVAVESEAYEDEMVGDSVVASTAWTNKRIEQIDDHYLRKDKDDRSVGEVASDKGFEVGNFVTGLIGGSGAKLYEDENEKTILEVDKIYGREELLVPKITYNCTDVITGETAQTFAYGEVKEVTANDDGTGTLSLELLEDEYGTLHENDICRGVFHFIDGNDTEYSEDGNGFHNYSGFSTSYFTPTSVAVNEAGRMELDYALQTGTTVHPCKGMKFFAYGNFFDVDRQSITYHTREYTRILAGVNQWVIDPSIHVVKQDGNLNGLEIGGQQMEGYSSYQKNVYITGSVIEFTPQQQEQLKGEGAYSVTLSSYVGTLRFNNKGELEEERHTEQGVEYYLRTTIQATRGTTELYFSDTIAADAFSASINPVGCTAELLNGTILVTSILDGVDYAYIEVDVSCEGLATYHLNYEIKTTEDGISSFDCMVFTRTNETPATPSGGSYESPLPTDVDAGGNLVWSDGIPSGESKVWMSSRTYSSDGNHPQTEWSEPQPLTDTADFEVVYNENAEKPAPPVTYPESSALWVPDNGWTDDATDRSVWMAAATKRNGVWSEWKVTKIKGERGIGAYTLSVSYGTVTRNSFGYYDPSNVVVRSVRDDVAENVYLAMFGIKRVDGTDVVTRLDMSGYGEHGSLWDIDVYALESYEFNAVEFHAYFDSLPNNATDAEDYAAACDASVGVNFVRDGENGEAGPMPRNCGEFSLYKHYYYNGEFRDFVWDNGTSGAKVYIRKTRNATEGDVEGAVYGVDVTNTTYWEEAPRESLTAIDTALIDTANIAGFMYRNGKMVSQETDPLNEDANLILDGNTGTITARKGTFKGDLYGKTISFESLSVDSSGAYVLPEISGRYGMFYMDNVIAPSRNVVSKTFAASGEDTIDRITGSSTYTSETSITITNQETLLLFSTQGSNGDYWAATVIPYWVYGREFSDSVANIQEISKESEATGSDILYIITG